MHQRGVGGQARQHFPDARGLVEQGVHAHDPPIDRRAQIRDHPLTQPSDQIKPQRGKHAEDHRRGQESNQISIERAGVLGGNDMVDELPQCQRQRQHGDRRHQQRGQGGGHHALIGLQERQQRSQRIQALGAGTVGVGAHAAMIP